MVSGIDFGEFNIDPYSATFLQKVYNGKSRNYCRVFSTHPYEYFLSCHWHLYRNTSTLIGIMFKKGCITLALRLGIISRT